MRIHHLRNATFVIESGHHFILVDPMLGGKGTFPPLSFIRHRPKRNPIIDLPSTASDILNQVNHCIITHCKRGHLDHLDIAGMRFLKDRKIPVTSGSGDHAFLKKKGINVTNSLTREKESEFLSGSITAIPAQHGHGWIKNFMANGVGYFIQLANEPTLYISGDTVLTTHVRAILSNQKPDITVVACGMASVDIGKPILMTLNEIIEFSKESPKTVIANHLEALNHCPLTRQDLSLELRKHELTDKVIIPMDGETIEIN